MNELPKIETRDMTSGTAQTCNARDLWGFVESRQDFSDWIKGRIEKYGFVEGEDWVSHKFMENPSAGGRPRTDYHLTIEVAKELAMVENNERGREVRRYFIDCERRAKRVPPLPASALHRADLVVAATRTFNGLLRAAGGLRLGHARAARSACESARRHTGIDLFEELGVTDDELAVAAPPPRSASRALAQPHDDGTTARVATWLGAPEQAGERGFTSEAILLGALAATPNQSEYRSLQTRLGYIMARLGWRRHRPGRGRWVYMRPV